MCDESDRSDIARHSAAVRAHEGERRLLFPRGIRNEVRPPIAGHRHAVWVDQDREMLAEDLLVAIAGHPLDRLGGERDLALGIGREDDVRRLLDEEPEALLRLTQFGFPAKTPRDVARAAAE